MHTILSKPHHLHGIRVVLFGMSLVALCLVRVDAQLLSPASKTGSVLAYATNMSRGDLVTYTNNARAQNGMGGFAVNDKLNNSAQAKANDMIARNYWSHNTPDGTAPWWFFDQAGYSYSTAGENLAYGFSDSASAVDGWMNSPPHRANILGAFTEVGFGIASGAGYQGGENTVVVAHYGTPTAPPAPVAPPPQVQSSAPQPSTPAAPPAAAAPTPTTETPAETLTPKQTAEKQNKTAPITPVITAAGSTTVPLWRTFQGGSVPLIGVISLLLLAGVAFGYGLTHRSLMKHAFITSENYALHHPVIDMLALAVVALLVLLTTVARIS